MLTLPLLMTALPGCKGPHRVDPVIAARVWELTSDDPITVQAALDFLLSQEPALVIPAIMENIDDLHPLTVKSVLIQDLRRPSRTPRRYHPQKFCDLLAALLFHITGHQNTYIYDGATDAQRLEAIAGWQKWWDENKKHY